VVAFSINPLADSIAVPGIFPERKGEFLLRTEQLHRSADYLVPISDKLLILCAVVVRCIVVARGLRVFPAVTLSAPIGDNWTRGN
jgi:hypothetical protein